MRRRNRGNASGEATRVFIKYLKDNDHPDVIKRDDLKTIYEGEFLLHRRDSNSHYTDIKYRSVLQYLRYHNMIHELGDYYIFGKNVQGEYGNIIGSEDYRKTLEKWQEKAACTPNFCGVCGVQCSGENDFDQHQNGTRHRIHKFHYDIYKNRDQMLTCPSGIEIESVPMVNTSLLIEKECRPKDEVFMLISIKNKSRDLHTLLLRRFLLLWDTGVFRLVQKDNTRPPRSKFHIQPGTSFEMRVQCKAPVDFGHHFVPLAFYFEWMDRNNKLIQDTADQHSEELVPRFVSVHVLGDLHEAMAPIGPYKKPDKIPDERVEETVPGEPCPKSGKNLLGGRLSPSFIPPFLKHQVDKGLNAKHEILDLKLRRAIDCDLDITNYKSKFDTLLWTEELQMIKDIKIYDLKSHEMTLDMHRGVMILEVPGLMERRPSVMRGDRVYIFADGNRNVRYEGIVHKVELETVDLGVSKRLRDTWIKGKRYEIRFDFLKFNLWVQHRALTGLKYAETILFPSEETSLSKREDNVPLKPWFDRNVNEEQRTAVTNIVQGTSRPGPYLIFGPPGTGKTVTVTEAIRQIYHSQPEARILACCPENTAADFLMKKLINPNQPGTIKKNDIYRLYAMSRPKITIPKEIMDSKQLNFDREERDFFYPAISDLKKFQILVMTLSTVGRLVSASFERNFFTHVFIDEGAHAIEPECIIPITGLLDDRYENCGQLVIAGDPKQLGPILRSQFARNFGLETSILERLMNTIPEYQRCESSGYNERFVTKLVRNYRSHDAIISVPRDLFYDGELEACGDRMILDSMLRWDNLAKRGFPIIFHSVFGADERESGSPSFFNRDEVSQVEKYLALLLKESRGGLKIRTKDIGIISPYRKQVAKIREMIQKKKFDVNQEKIMIGSVEEFQGQEFKVIIISTVRSNQHYVQKDVEHRLGFVKNPKRFNVALTRARSLLIVIGNPMILEKDDNWKSFLDYCESNGGFKGQRGHLKPRERSENDSENLEFVHGELASSVRSQIEDQEFVNRD